MHKIVIKYVAELVTLSIIIQVLSCEASSRSDRADFKVRISRSAPYHGQWDLSGKHTAMLCEAVKKGQAQEEGEDSGEELPEPERDTYIRDEKCWKNQWIPCENNDADDRLATEGILSKRRKPCGYYKMVSDSDC